MAKGDNLTKTTESQGDPFAERWAETNGGCDEHSARFWFDEGFRAQQPEAATSEGKGEEILLYRTQNPATVEQCLIAFEDRVMWYAQAKLRGGSAEIAGADMENARNLLLKAIATQSPAPAVSEEVRERIIATLKSEHAYRDAGGSEVSSILLPADRATIIALLQTGKGQ